VKKKLERVLVTSCNIQFNMQDSKVLLQITRKHVTINCRNSKSRIQVGRSKTSPWAQKWHRK